MKEEEQKIEIIIGNSLNLTEINNRVNNFQNTFIDIASKFYTEQFEKDNISKSKKE
jgi:hypothetical protein